LDCTSLLLEIGDMQTVDALISAKNNSTSVAVHTFILMTGINSNDLICFFENKDAPYYIERIKNYSSVKYQFIRCGNKSKVIETYKHIKFEKKYNKYKTCFFVDSDFDESLLSIYPDLYETPCYSIENLYNSNEVFEDILKSEFGFNYINAEFSTLITLYEKLSNEFNNSVALFNAWYHAVKTKSRRQGIISNINLGESFPSNYLKMSLAGISATYSLATIRKDFPDAIHVTDDEVDNSLQFLLKNNPFLSFRGKYQIQFLTYLIMALVEDSKPKGNRNILSNSINLHVSRSNILSHFSQYALTPECLKSYLSKFS